MRRPLALAGIVGAGLLLAGCLTLPLPSSGPVAFRHGTGANMDALLTGTLHLDDDCVWVETEYGDYLPVFELGVARFEGGELVYGHRYSDGDRIEVGGGDTGQSSGEGMYIPDGCPELRIWAAAGPPEA